MTGTIPIAGDLDLATLSATITQHEQWSDVQLTGLVADNTSTKNLATFSARTAPIGGAAIVPTGTNSPGTAITTNTTIYINSTKVAVDVYHLPL
jgi:hypothetical protein